MISWVEHLTIIKRYQVQDINALESVTMKSKWNLAIFIINDFSMHIFFYYSCPLVNKISSPPSYIGISLLFSDACLMALHFYFHFFFNWFHANFNFVFKIVFCSSFQFSFCFFKVYVYFTLLGSVF